MRCLLVLLAGCAFGGGPVIGYGERTGLVIGGEATGGMFGLEGAAGYTSGMRYVHVDYSAPADYHSLDGTVHPVTRVGLGAGLTTSLQGDAAPSQWHLMVLAGEGAQRSASNYAQVCDRTETDGSVFSATVELRYAGELEIVLVPRYRWGSAICMGGGSN